MSSSKNVVFRSEKGVEIDLGKRGNGKKNKQRAKTL